MQSALLARAEEGRRHAPGSPPETERPRASTEYLRRLGHSYSATQQSSRLERSEVEHRVRVLDGGLFT